MGEIQNNINSGVDTLFNTLKTLSHVLFYSYCFEPVRLSSLLLVVGSSFICLHKIR